MKTEIHKIATARHSVIDMADDTVMKIIPKNGQQFKGNVHAYTEGGELVLSYADGTSVTLANL